jgi:phage terminase large subunit
MAQIKLLRAFSPILDRARYKVFYGGRGSGKSWAAAQFLLYKSLERPCRILCTREYQSSISDSVHKLLADSISALKLDYFFEITRNQIRSVNGSEFIFSGLAQHVESIKSYEGIDFCWCEEAERISERSWDVLIPTIRKPASEIIITFNPQFKTDPTYKRFIESPPPNAIIVKVNFDQNPYFPETLRQEMIYCRETDYDKYNHIWAGETRSFSDAQIFKGKYVVQEFSSDGVENFRFGADWGFAKDPTVLIRCFVRDQDLYIDHEAVGHGIDIDKIPELFRSIPGTDKYKIWADAARPETISYISQNGFHIEGAPKWPGSVEDGIAFIRSFRQIIIHPRCKNTIYEMGAYSYKIDKQTQEVLPIVVDAKNHCVDSIRYGLSPLITKKTTIFDSNVV